MSETIRIECLHLAVRHTDGDAASIAAVASQLYRFAMRNGTSSAPRRLAALQEAAELAEGMPDSIRSGVPVAAWIEAATVFDAFLDGDDAYRDAVPGGSTA